MKLFISTHVQTRFGQVDFLFLCIIIKIEQWEGVVLFMNNRKMDDKILQLVRRIKNYLIEKYGERIKEIILYGSYAREQFTENSDIDILVLVDDTLSPFEVRKNISDLLLDILLDEGELVSVIVLPESFFENYNYPFMINVKKEGVKI